MLCPPRCTCNALWYVVPCTGNSAPGLSLVAEPSGSTRPAALWPPQVAEAGGACLAAWALHRGPPVPCAHGGPTAVDVTAGGGMEPTEQDGGRRLTVRGVPGMAGQLRRTDWRARAALWRCVGPACVQRTSVSDAGAVRVWRQRLPRCRVSVRGSSVDSGTHLRCFEYAQLHRNTMVQSFCCVAFVKNRPSELPTALPAGLLTHQIGPGVLDHALCTLRYIQ